MSKGSIPRVEESTLIKWEAMGGEILAMLASAKATKVWNTEPQGNPNTGNVNEGVAPWEDNNSNFNGPNGHRINNPNGSRNDNGGCTPQNHNH